jgi:hypothetical protein
MADNHRQHDLEVKYLKVHWLDEHYPTEYIPRGNGQKVHPESYTKTLQIAHASILPTPIGYQ